jgi:hypothetical protein
MSRLPASWTGRRGSGMRCSARMRPVADDREPLGRIVHEIRLAWNAELAHPRGVLPWEQRDEGQREMDMRIGSAVAAQAVADAGLEIDRMRAQLLAFAAGRDRTVRELKRRASRAVPGVVRDAWLAAADVVAGTQERSDEKEAGRG